MKVASALAGLVVASTLLSSLAAPALALGRCGPNGHRDRWNHCVFGGQNQGYCMRTKGHPAVRMPNGALRCI